MTRSRMRAAGDDARERAEDGAGGHDERHERAAGSRKSIGTSTSWVGTAKPAPIWNRTRMTSA